MRRLAGLARHLQLLSLPARIPHAMLVSAPSLQLLHGHLCCRWCQAVGPAEAEELQVPGVWLRQTSWLPWAKAKHAVCIGLPAALPPHISSPRTPCPLQAPYDGTPTAAVAFDHSGLYLGVGGAGEWQRLAPLSHGTYA